MYEKKGNIVLFVILAILMIVAIAIVLVNPNQSQKTAKVNTKVAEVSEEENEVKEKVTSEDNETEEKRISMQEGGNFCKIGNKIVFYEDENKTINLYNMDENKGNTIATLEHSINKMYFDGENIYYIPSYYLDKSIYKIDLQGNKTKIYDGASLQLYITEKEIYFVKQIGWDDINQNPQGTICKMDKDGNNVIEIAQNIKNYFFMNKDKIYYTTQDRKMYEIDKDGNNEKQLTTGRRFIIGISDKYLIYIDYANQEAEHIINLDTQEDSIIGNFGFFAKYQNRTFLNARKRLEDGALENDFTLFEINDDASITEIGKITSGPADIKYIEDNKAYVYTQQEGINIINLENYEKQSGEKYNQCRHFLGGYGYTIDKDNPEGIKIERLEL